MAPSSDEIERTAIKRYTKAYQAGLIPFYLFALKELNKPTSLNRAFRMVENRYSKKKAQKRQIPHSEVSILKNWRKFKSVSHLWASHIAFYEDVTINNQTKFDLFLAYAEFFRFFCEGIIAEKVIKPIIKPGEMWRVPLAYTLPDIEPPRLANIDEGLLNEIENYSVSGA